jgi:hypothetical protein
LLLGRRFGPGIIVGDFFFLSLSLLGCCIFLLFRLWIRAFQIICWCSSSHSRRWVSFFAMMRDAFGLTGDAPIKSQGAIAVRFAPLSVRPG